MNEEDSRFIIKLQLIIIVCLTAIIVGLTVIHCS